MTVVTEQSSIVFAGIIDGVPLNVPFPVQATSELVVRYGALDTVVVLGVGYTVALVPPDYLTATVTPLPGLAALSGGTVSVRREVPYTQPTDIPTLVTLTSARLEQMFDRLVFIAQQVRDALVYALRFPTTDQAANIGPLPTAADRALKFLAFDANSKPIAAVGVTGTAPMTAFGASWVTFVTGLAALTSAAGLGFSNFMAGLRATVDLPALQTALGFTAFTKTLIPAADAATMRGLLSVYSTAQIDVFNATFGRIGVQGWTYGPNAGTPASQIDIAVGAGHDSTFATFAVGVAMTKKIDTAWAAGTGNGSLDTGAIGNNDYDIYAIWGVGVAVDYITVIAGNAPVLPGTYVSKVLIGWFRRTAGSIVAFHTYEAEGGAIDFTWDVPTLDINLANTLTTARRTDLVRVPAVRSVIAELNVLVFDAGANFRVNICNPDQIDAATSNAAAPLCNISQTQGNQGTSESMKIRTSAAGLIAARADIATVDLYLVVTVGFRMRR